MKDSPKFPKETFSEFWYMWVKGRGWFTTHKSRDRFTSEERIGLATAVETARYPYR